MLAAGAPEHDGAGVGLGRLVDQREDAFGRREPALDDRLHVGQRLQLVREVQERRQVRDEVADADSARRCALPDARPRG